jgi:asparagine synthase (glutamine-hydrolysing)
MCGIAGIFNLDSDRPVSDDELRAMIATMPHRGPDARGAQVLAPGAGFGHVRLAILDLVPESNQPFAIDGGAYVITYNGEIFNYVELREELEGLGHAFRTRSDTEVLVRAYATWGADAVNRLNGMWAFAIWDRDRDELFCSRDRFGIKPFSYTEHDGRFLFSSEVKAMLAIAPELARPDHEALSQLLRSSVGGRSHRTCFAGVRRLPPAHNMIVRRSGIRLERYWDYPTDTMDGITAEEAAAGVRERLVDALRLRMRSDVPVGTTLSGGVDSSAIVCLLRSFYDDPHETFTASYAGESYDESDDAVALATRLGMNPNRLPAQDEDFLPTLRKVVHHLEAPVYNPAVFPLWNIMRGAREKVTVVLEGQGADELFGGYVRSAYPFSVLDHLAGGRLLSAAKAFRWNLRVCGAPATLMWTGRALAPWVHRFYRRIRGDERVYLGPLRDAAGGSPARRNGRMPGVLNRHLRDQHEGTLVDLLHYGDAISMAFSLESRLPFMDYRLVEYAFRIPGHLKVGEGRGKLVLRNAVRRDVPLEVIDSRRKLGFPTPIAKWFRERPDVTIEPILQGAACRERGLFDPAAVDATIAQHCAGRDHSYNLFRWTITELWFQEFID